MTTEEKLSLAIDALEGIAAQCRIQALPPSIESIATQVLTKIRGEK